MSDPALAERDYARASRFDPWFAPHAATAFEVLSQLGEGGMGSVYEVRDRRTGRLAALKLARAAGDARLAARLAREARVTARLDHPAIPPVYELGRSPRGELFILMRAVRGQTLEAELAELGEAPLASRRPLIQALVEVAQALACAHAQGILHRDLKPTNIMIGRFGEVLLLDWGVARDLRDPEAAGLDTPSISPAELAASGLTVSGAAVGTPGYMAPEQARGEELDARADVYALGLLLGEVLTGRPLAAGEGALARQIANAEGRHRGLDPSWPPGLRWLLEAALAPDPAARTASAGAFAEQLQAWLAGEPIPGRREGWLEGAQRQVRRRPAAWLGLLVIAALAPLLGVIVEARGRAEDRARALALARRDEAQARDRAERAQRLLSALARARDEARRGQLAALEETLNATLTEFGDDPETLLAAAEVASQAGLVGRARHLYEGLARDHPPAYEALYALHVLEAGADSVALTAPLTELMERAAARGDENAFTLHVQACDLEARGDRGGAVAVYDRLLDQHRRFAPAYYNRGNILADRGELEAALRDYDAAIHCDPRFAAAWFNRGVTRAEAGDLAGARRDYDAALALKPGDARTLNNRGNLRLSLGDERGALDDFSQALAADPRHVEALVNRGNLRARRGDLRGSIEDFDAALALAPQLTAAHFNRASSRLRLGDLEGALRDYDRVIAAAPEQLLPRFNRAAVRRQLGDLRGALEDAEAVVAGAPSDLEARLLRARLREATGDLRGAAEDLEAALLIAPRHPAAAELRGQIERLRGG